MRHTQGKWLINKPDFENIEIINTKGQFICTISSKSEFIDDECKANAKLIAQSPIMLSLLKEEVEYLNGWMVVIPNSTIRSQMAERKDFILMTIKQATDATP